MKKWGWKKFAVAGLAFALSFQSTAFAGEIVIFDDEESVTEATTHDSEDSEETESQTETQKETENRANSLSLFVKFTNTYLTPSNNHVRIEAQRHAKDAKSKILRKVQEKHEGRKQGTQGIIF